MKKAPANYYTTVNQKKLNTGEIPTLDARVTAIEGHGYLPEVDQSDAGKILKVSEEGAWGVGDDENTIIVANPETGTATEELENLKIGNTIYSVNKPTFEYIKGIRLTVSDGGQYRTDKPKVEFYDDGGNLVTTPTYTASCDKSYAGNINLDNVCSIATTDAPGIFTYVFDNTMAVTINHLIKLTNAGAFAGDIAKSVKVELTADGENWVELWFDPSIAWSGSSNAYRIIDIKTGEVSNTLLPIVTSADNSKVLSVVNGVWDKANVPTELPAVTSSDNGKVLSVSNGNWNKNTIPKVTIIPCTVIAGANMVQLSRYNIGNIKDIVTNTSVFDMVMLHNINSPYEYYYCTGYEIDSTNTYASFIRVTRGATFTTYEKALFDITDTTSNMGTYSVTTVNDPT